MPKKTVDFVKEFNFGRVEGMEVGADEEGTFLSVTFSCPVPGFTSPAGIEETFYLHWSRYSRLNKLVQDLSQEVERIIKEGVNVEGDPCSVCTATCCSEYANSITVTHEDFHRIVQSGLGQFEDFKQLGRDDAGYYGKVRTKEVDGTTWCTFYDVKRGKCSIHKVKPQVCADYSPFSCNLFEKKLVKLRRKHGSQED